MHDVSARDSSCPLCKNGIAYLSADLRPVFPQERLLFELLAQKCPLELAESSVWFANARYYVNGKPFVISKAVYENADTTQIKTQLQKFSEENERKSQSTFNHYIELFCRANENHKNEIIRESHSFIIDTASDFSFPAKNILPEEKNIVISFSGGKDSTATADLVCKALGTTSLVHIFGNTTLEFPATYEYTERYKKNHPKAIFKTAVNAEQNFMQVCEDIGPPARMMRWCCSMFKTGPITRTLNNLFGNEKVLTFYGIRKVESVARSKYKRLEDDLENIKIKKQNVASPIFEWSDLELWLYLLSEKVDFNDAYKLGYERVGCWCCPNNNSRDLFLSKIYMTDKAEAWRNFLIRFANSIGKQDAEVYVDTGKWKARQGGNGVQAAEDIKIKFSNCTTEDNAKVYVLNRAADKNFYMMFTPFGKVNFDLGRKLLGEVLVFDIKSNVPIISITPFTKEGVEYSVKIKTLNVADHDDLQKKIGYQVRKFNACRKCLKCESVCTHGAISIKANEYLIDENKCTRCKMCVSAKYLSGGCAMTKYLAVKQNTQKNIMTENIQNATRWRQVHEI